MTSTLGKRSSLSSSPLLTTATYPVSTRMQLPASRPSSQMKLTPTLDLLRGHPSARLLPTPHLYEAAGVALNSPSLLPHDSYAENRHPLAYGPDSGNVNVREEIGKWCAERYRLKAAIPAENMYITNGASFGLHMALSLFTSPGTGYTKAAFLVSPTYFLAGRTFEDCGFADKMVAAPAVGMGRSIDFSALVESLQRVDREKPDVSLEEGLRPLLRRGVGSEKKRIYKFVLYCVPTYSNPTGETWNLETRKKVVQIAREWDMLVISDDVYDFLGNDDQLGGVLPRLVTLDAETAEGEGNTISNCSFSKLIGPGLRVGWIESATRVLARQMADGGAGHSGGCPSQLASCILYPLLLPISPHNPQRKIDIIISTLTATYTARSRALKKAIESHLPKGTEVHGGVGGFFVWAGLPDGVDAAEVIGLAREQEGVVVASGEMSECPGEGNRLGWGRRWIRISVSYCEEEELVEGIKRLGRAVGRWKEGGRVRSGGGAVVK